MRTLLLFRGAPGCGKSTFIKEHGLERYTISSDTVRMLYSSPELRSDGTIGISQKINSEIWNAIYNMIKFRMSKGEFIVIDSTNTNANDMRKLRSIADENRYKVFIIDMTNIPIETVLERNKMRDPERVVPEYAIRNIYEKYKTEKIPSGIEVLKPEEYSKIFEQPIDLSKYKKVIHIGDIHGCYSTLMKYFEKYPMSKENAYIFVGDYLDRGNENAKTFEFIRSISEEENVCLLEGNHEKWIYCFGKDIEAKSDEFEQHTKPELKDAGIDGKDARILYRKFKQMSHYIYNGKEVLVCHGGIPCMSAVGDIPYINHSLTLVPTYDFIHGVGSYPEYKDIAGTWMRLTKDNQYLIHGHRNTENDETQIADRVFNLEGGVEFGGELRIVELSKDGFQVITIPSCQPVLEGSNTDLLNPELLPIHDVITILRNNRFIKESKLENDISSFNFSKAAFYDSNWNSQTILARGLFIDTKHEEIIGRSYEKFFRINETKATTLEALEKNLKFPIMGYVKENGFLGLVSYNPHTDSLFISSKSRTNGEYVGYFSEILKKYNLEKIKENLKKYPGFTMVFEVIDIINDPHIIEYPESKIVLLDMISNKIKFEKMDYETLLSIAEDCNLEVKKLAFKINNWEDFLDIYNNINGVLEFKYNGELVEGFVFEDSTGFMFKLKTEYYNFWKQMRGIAGNIYKYSDYLKKNSLTEDELKFYNFCYKLNSEGKLSNPNDIISLRKLFEKGDLK